MSDYAVSIALKALDEASGPMRKVQAESDGLRGKLAGLADTILSGFGMGIGMQFGQQFTETLRNAATAGFEFNRSMEDSRTGIAAVIMANMDFAKASGDTVTAQEKVSESLRMASEVQEKLKVDALGTSASYLELAGAFNSALAPALAAGITDLDKVRQITVQATQAMSALSIPTDQAAQEIRALFAGETGPDARLNQQLRVTKEELAAVKGNADATAQLFLSKLKPYADMAAEASKNFTTRLSNLGDAFDQVMGAATKPIFDAFKGAISDMTGNVGGFQSKLVEIGQKIGELVTAVAPYIPKLIEFGVALLGAGVSFLSSLQPVLPVLGGILELVTDLVRELGPMGLGLLAAASAFDKIHSGATLAVAGTKALTTYMGGVGLTTLGVYAAAIGVVVGALYALKLAFDLQKETEAVEKSYKGMADTMVMNLGRIEKAHPELKKEVDRLKNSIIAAQQQGGDAVEKSAGTFQREFNKIAAEARAAAPPITSVKDAITAAAKAPPLDPKQAESVKKLGEEHDKVKEKILGHIAVLQAPENTSAYEKFRQNAEKEIGEITKKWGGDSDLIRLRQEQLTLELQAEAKKQAANQKVAPIEIANSWEENAARALSSVSAFGTNLVLVMKFPLENMKAEMANAWFKITENIKDQVDSAGAFVNGVWAAMAGGIDEFFGDVFTGKGVDLQKTFEGIFGGIQQSFGNMVSDMVQRWIAGKQSITEGLQGLGAAMRPFQGGGAGAAIGNYATSAAIGYGIGSTIGGMSDAPGFSGGASAGGAIGSIFGIVGTVVGAIIGGIIGVLLSPNTEGSVSAAFSEMLANSTNNAFARAGRQVLDAQQNWMSSFFEMGAKEAGLSAAELTASYQKNLKTLLTGGWAKISAGDTKDIESGAERFLRENLPRLAMQAAFGQTGFGPHGNRDKAGGQAGLDWWINWMDKDGNAIAKKLYDPEAPIPKMLAGLGFTARKITELATQLTTEDPEKFKTRLENLVGLVLDINKALAGYKGGRAGIEAELAGLTGRTTADYFRDSAQGIADAAKAMDALTGDEALARAREIATAANQRYQEELQAIQQIKNLARSISESIASQREDIRLRLMGTGERTSFFQQQIQALYAQLGAATTEAEVQRITQQIQKYAGSLVDLAFGGEKPDMTLVNWIDKVLGETDVTAQARLSTFIDDIVGTNEVMLSVLDDLKTRFTEVGDATDGLVDTATGAADSLSGLDDAAKGAKEALIGLAEAVVEAVARIGDATGDTIRTIRTNRRVLMPQVGR